MKLTEYFKAFLDEEVNLDSARLERLNGHVEAIANFLEGSSTFSQNFIDIIPQGSYAHKTIIQPVRQNDEFDADLLLHITEFADWEPSDYVQKLYECFRISGVYREKVSRRTRCVTVNYAGDFHIDVVPFLERNSQKWITNRHENNFELTNPEGYNSWLNDRDRSANRNLVPVIRLIKYLRDFKTTFDVKSVVLNVLIGDRVNDVAVMSDPKCYSDVPTTLRTVMQSLKAYLQPRPGLPTILDPSGTGENLGDRWNQDGYTAFRSAMIRYAEWIDDAWSDPELDNSLQKWQRVFGISFKKPVVKQMSGLIREDSALPVRFNNTEQDLSKDLAISVAINVRFQFRISGRVTRKGGLGAYYLHDRGNKVLRNRSIQFQVEVCNVPPPYQVLWKILNRGTQAQERDSIRGQIIASGRSWKQTEPTSFAGPHFVEAYVVKDGVCVARDRQDVIIL